MMIHRPDPVSRLASLARRAPFHELASRRLALPIAAPLALALAACSGDVVNMGENPGDDGSFVPPPQSSCADNPTLQGDVVVRNQAELDALEGCTAIDGNLLIELFFDPDLRPLHELTTVRGELGLGGGDLWWSARPSAEEADALARANAESGVLLRSLEGLEQLETVGSLTLMNVAIDSLAPLAGLRQLTGYGRLAIYNADAITDLTPLARLEGIQRLSLVANNLTSLDGLQIAEQLVSLGLAGASLSNIDALSRLREVSGDVSIYGTALSDLAPLAGLGYVSSLGLGENRLLETLHGLEALEAAETGLYLVNNPVLRDTSALASLLRAEELIVEGNDSLERLPELPQLRTNTIRIRNNARLQALPTLRGTFNGFGPRADPEVQLSERGQVEILLNPALQSFSMPREWRDGVFVIIEDNASLREIDLGDLESLDLLQIANNAALDSVRLGPLDTVDTLEVVENPRLPPATFDTLRTFERTMSGNAM